MRNFKKIKQEKTKHDKGHDGGFYFTSIVPFPLIAQLFGPWYNPKPTSPVHACFCFSSHCAGVRHLSVMAWMALSSSSSAAFTSRCRASSALPAYARVGWVEWSNRNRAMAGMNQSILIIGTQPLRSPTPHHHKHTWLMKGLTLEDGADYHHLEFSAAAIAQVRGLHVRRPQLRLELGLDLLRRHDRHLSIPLCVCMHESMTMSPKG